MYAHEMTGISPVSFAWVTKVAIPAVSAGHPMYWPPSLAIVWF
jgi:hypothetical protein